MLYVATSKHSWYRWNVGRLLCGYAGLGLLHGHVGRPGSWPRCLQWQPADSGMAGGSPLWRRSRWGWSFVVGLSCQPSSDQFELMQGDQWLLGQALGQPPLRLWNFCPLCEAPFEVPEVPVLRFARRRELLGKDGAWPSLFCTLTSFVPGAPNNAGDDRHHLIGKTDGMESHGGAPQQTVSRLLGTGSRCGRQGQGSTRPRGLPR